MAFVVRTKRKDTTLSVENSYESLALANAQVASHMQERNMMNPLESVTIIEEITTTKEILVYFPEGIPK